jgi:hypothetical protein
MARAWFAAVEAAGPLLLPARVWVLLALLAASCTPVVPRHDIQPAGPSASVRHEDLELLKSPAYSALRGAAASESPGSELRRRRAIANALTTDYIRRREGPIYRRRDRSEVGDGFPQVCLALSGGGMRALAFATGVMYALEQSGEYARINVISAASGGGWASYWVLRNIGRGDTEAAVLSGARSPALLQLRANGSALAGVWTGTNLVGGFMQHGIEQRINVQQSRAMIMGRDASVQLLGGAGHESYGAAIEHMLGRSALPGADTGLPDDALRELVRSGRVPVPVWVAAARPASQPMCAGTNPVSEMAERSRSISYAAFEVGPTRMGSDELGYVTHMLMQPIDAAAVSAAAMSLPINEHCALMHTIDATLRITNFPARRDPSAPVTTSQASLPTDADFDLMDGGLADNLALLPLVRRLCADIIVVDAGFDPYLAFDDYGYVRQQMAQLDIELSIPALDALAARNRIPDSQVPCQRGVCLVRPRPECVHREPGSGCIANDELPNAVFEGAIRAIPLAFRTNEGADPWAIGERALHVRYIKLALDGTRIDRYPDTVRALYLHDLALRRPASASVGCTAAVNTGACTFPHMPTADLDFRGAKFAAYWDLGRCIVEQDLKTPGQAPQSRCANSDWPP